MRKLLLLFILLTSIGVVFAQRPYVTNVTPSSGPVGTVVTIGGLYFNANAANNIVYFGGVRANVTAATSTSISVTVPVGAGYQNVSVLNASTGLSGESVIPFVLTSDTKSTISSSDIDPKVDFAAGYSPRSATMADIDGDGKLDIAVLNTLSGYYSVSVFLNTATKGIINASSFAVKKDIPTGNVPTSVILKDIDGDGLPDMIITDKQDNTVSVYHNTSTIGQISFGPRVSFATATSPLSLAVGDIDGDGKPDLVVATASSVSILLNNTAKGSITSSSFAVKYDMTAAFNSVITADLDGDGKLDIAGVNSLGAVSVFHNIMTNTGPLSATSFATKLDFLVSGGPVSVVAADMCNHGKLDLVTVNSNNNTITVLQNATNGGIINSGSFLPGVSFTTGKFPTQIAVNDIDGDGLLDVIINNYSDNTLSIFRNNFGGSTFSTTSLAPKVDLPTSSFPSSIAIGDLDGDGRSDIAITNDLTSMSVLRNNPTNPPTITSISPLNGPVGTTVTITGTNFNKYNIANNVVYFGATKGIITSATATQIVVTVPAGSTYNPISVLNTDTKRTAYSPKPFNVTYSGNTGIRSVDFVVPQNAGYSGSQNTNVELYDMDGDGKPDMISGNYTAQMACVSLNTGTGGPTNNTQFAPSVNLDCGYAIDVMRIADIDGDGLLDIITICGAKNTLSILRNISTPGKVAFDKRMDISTTQFNLNSLQIEVKDVSMDGKPDMIIRSDAGIFVYRNTSSPGFISFAAQYTLIYASTSEGLQVGDIDGDGKPDIVYSNYSGTSSYTDGIYVLRNTSTNTAVSFAPGVQIATIHSTFKLVDLDGDNKLDIVVTYYGGETFTVYRNTAVPGIITPSSMSAAITIDANQDRPLTAYAADMDGDGKPDLVTANMDEWGHSTFTIYHNGTTGNNISFDYSASVETPKQPWSIAIGDLNNDGLPDLLVNSDTYVRPYYYSPVPPAQTIAPKITGVTPLTGPAGTLVTITGNNFNTTATGNSVNVGDVNLKVQATTPNSLTVTMPANANYNNILVNNLATNRVSNPWLPFSRTFPSKNSISAADFSDPAYIRTSLYNFGSRLIDVDGDGKLDLVVPSGLNTGTYKLSIYRNISAPGAPLGSQSFATKVDIDCGTTSTPLIVDTDGDGLPDVVSPTTNTIVYAVQKNTSTPGNISFASAVVCNVPGPVVAVADMDGDGLPDMISTDGSGSLGIACIVLSKNISRNTPYTFAKLKRYATKDHPNAVNVADLDGDGKPDIITANQDASISIFRNTSISTVTGNPSFAPFFNLDAGIGAYFAYSAVGDIDGDGKPDIVAVTLADSILVVYRNTSVNGVISFAPKVVFKQGLSPTGNINITDMDGDGKPDIIVTMSSRIYMLPAGVAIFRNLSTPGSFTTGSLAQRVDIPTGGTHSVSVGDLDGDGKPDLVLTAYNVLTIYQNNPQQAAAPAISAFSPLTATKGTTVYIKGTGFSGATTVSFGATAATSFKVVSPTIITAVVPTGSTGTVTVTTPLGTASLGGFTYSAAPPNGMSLTPLADTVLVTLGSNGTKQLSITDLATINNAGSANPQITITPASVDCTTTGFRTVTVTVTDPSTPFNPAAVKFNHPSSVALDVNGNMYVVDANNYRIRKITPAGLVSTIAGNGTATSSDGVGTNAGINTYQASTAAADPFGNVFVTAGSVRKIDAQGNLTTFAISPGSLSYGSYASSGPDIASTLGAAAGITIAPDGTQYVVGQYNGQIAKVTPTGVMTVLAGTGSSALYNGRGDSTAFASPQGITLDAAGNLFVADNNNFAIRKITTNGRVSTFAGANGATSKDGTLKTAAFAFPSGIVTDNAGNMYVTEKNCVRKIDIAGNVTTIGGQGNVSGYVDGPAATSKFNTPGGLAVDASGNVYVADYNNNCIRKIDPSGNVSTYAGGIQGYQDGSIGGVSSTTTSVIKMKVISNIAITNTFANQTLPLDPGGKSATIPDYTISATFSGSCGTAGIKITQSPAAGTKLNPTASAVVTITATDISGVSVSKTFNVTADANKLVVFSPIPDVVYGAADFAPNVTAPTNSTVTFVSTNPAVATIVNNNIHIIGAGSTTITATSVGSYVDTKSQSLNIKAAPLTIKANDQSRFAGASNPALTVSYSGFVYNDTQASLSSQPIVTTTAGISSPAGSYPITASGAAAANYVINYQPGTLTVTATLPPTNFKLSTTSATCKGSANGIVKIVAAQHLNYTATVTGGSLNAPYPFTDSVSIPNLAAGTYNVCITVAGQATYQQCFSVVITEPKDLSVYAASVTPGNQVVLTLNGGTTYNVNLNGNSMTTSASSVTLSLAKGTNTILVSTDKACQGVIEKDITVSDEILAYPNPFDRTLNLALGKGTVKQADIVIFGADGRQVYNNSFTNVSGAVQLDLPALKAGLYVLKLSADGVDTVFKIVKK